MIDKAFSLIQMIGDLVNKYQEASAYYKDTSLTEVTGVCRVEPTLVVSKDLMNYEQLTDINTCLLNLFAGYYLQAVALSAKIDNVKVVSVLDRLNPDRNMLAMSNIGMETVKDIAGLLPESFEFALPTQAKLSLEADNSGYPSVTEASGDIGIFREVSALAVGKMLNVDIRVNDKSVKLPVSIRLIPAFLNDAAILRILAMKTEDQSLTERIHAWRSGRISFWKDLMLCQDLIDESKKAMMEDEAGVYSEIMRRVNNAKKYGILARNPSLVSASNLYVMSENVARSLELKMGGKLANPRIRQRVFDSTYGMIIAVVDRELERVTFYFRGIALPTDSSFKEIKNSNKNKGPEILDVLKALTSGSGVSF